MVYSSGTSIGFEKKPTAVWAKMGNEPSKSNSRLGVCAIAFTTTNIEAAEFQIIADKIKTFADPSVCSRTEFDDAIKEIEKFEESDRKLLTRLFVMFDNTGEVCEGASCVCVCCY